MADKDFKVKNKLIVKGISSAGPLTIDSSGNVDSTSSIATQYGGTGTTQSPNAGQILYSASGTSYAPTDLSSVVTSWTNNSTSSNITLVKNNRYFVDTSSTRTLTLPSSPSIGDSIEIYDASGTSATNNITINSNSGKINGTVQNLTIDVNGAAFSLIYTGSAYGWVVR